MNLTEKRIERAYPNIEYTAYFDGKAIAQDEFGKLYYQEMPEEFFESGTVALLSDLTPIGELPFNEQEKIESFISGVTL